MHIAEELGMSLSIGVWMIRNACIQMNTWIKNRAIPRRIAVYLTTKQSIRRELVNDIDKILNETQIDPNLLEIELTGDTVLSKEEDVLKKHA